LLFMKGLIANDICYSVHNSNIPESMFRMKTLSPDRFSINTLPSETFGIKTPPPKSMFRRKAFPSQRFRKTLTPELFRMEALSP